MVILPAVGVVVLIVAVLTIIGRHNAIRSAEDAAQQFLSARISREKYLKQCYGLITSRFRSTNYGFLVYPWRNFFGGEIWNKGNILPCHIQSALLERCLLLKFRKDELRSVWVVFRHPMILHNFLEVKINNKWISVDPWGRRHGIPLGENMLSREYMRNSK